MRDNSSWTSMIFFKAPCEASSFLKKLFSFSFYEMAKLENLWKLKCGIILHGPPWFFFKAPCEASSFFKKLFSFSFFGVLSGRIRSIDLIELSRFVFKTVLPLPDCERYFLWLVFPWAVFLILILPFSSTRIRFRITALLWKYKFYIFFLFFKLLSCFYFVFSNIGNLCR